MPKVLGNLKKGLLFVLSAPAGTGKTTLVKMLQDEFSCVVPNVSYTSRAPRKNEVNGTDYHFISVDEFDKKIEEGEFLEYVELYGNKYGTSRKSVEDQLNHGNHVVLVIDTQGAMKLMREIPLISIFVTPPSLEELERRLVERDTECDKSISKRLEWAKEELENCSFYDYLIINEKDKLNIAYKVLKSILIAEEHKTRYSTEWCHLKN